MKALSEIKIRSLDGKPLGEVIEKSEWSRRKHITKIQDGTAKVISPRLAIYQYSKRTEYNPARYHVIHIPTGLVIADVEYADIGLVKNSFERLDWSLHGDNTFVLQNSPKLSWSMTCLIRYEVVENQPDVN